MACLFGVFSVCDLLISFFSEALPIIIEFSGRLEMGPLHTLALLGQATSCYGHHTEVWLKYLVECLQCGTVSLL